MILHGILELTLNFLLLFDLVIFVLLEASDLQKKDKEVFCCVQECVVDVLLTDSGFQVNLQLTVTSIDASLLIFPVETLQTYWPESLTRARLTWRIDEFLTTKRFPNHHCIRNAGFPEATHETEKLSLTLIWSKLLVGFKIGTSTSKMRGIGILVCYVK